jgi:formylglycine-generating enzyme required for sulfatase activity
MIGNIARTLLCVMATTLLAVVISIGCGSKETATVDTEVDLSIEMMFVEGGTLTLGYTLEQKYEFFRLSLPPHSVTVGDFYIGKYEVTQKQWFQVMGTTTTQQRDKAIESSWSGSTYRPLVEEGDSLPMSYVSWIDVQEFIVKLNSMTGKNYRLPTEDEWEFAARGGTKSRGYKYSGSNNLAEVAWYYENSGDEKLKCRRLLENPDTMISNNNRVRPVGSKQPNELGIYDMSGNVWEWTDGVFHTILDDVIESLYSDSEIDNHYFRVARGGSWYHCHSVGHSISFRYGPRPETRDCDLGFRLALSPIATDTLSVGSDTGKKHKLAAKPAAAVDKKKPKRVASDSNSGKTIDDIAMVFVKGGTFTMGCTAEQESECEDNEKPSHNVTVDDFLIGKYEVTQELWKQVVGTEDFQRRYEDYTSILSRNKIPSDEQIDNLPMSHVTWGEVLKFIVKLNAMTGKNYRLPTEAEWEFAARGGTKSNGYKYSGSDNLAEVAWYAENSGSLKHPVGTKQPNELGICDMSGNVMEWINDKGDQPFYRKYYTVKARVNPKGQPSGSYRIIRGGNWYASSGNNRVSSRGEFHRDNKTLTLGFRLAMSP